MEHTYQKTTVEGFTVEVFKTFNGVKLFITDADGVEIYAHRVSGDPLERAREVIAQTIETVEAVETQVAEMLCLSQREQEFFAAVTRAAEGDLEVFEDFETDSFVVKNYENGKEYRVRLETSDGALYGSCECADHIYRQRICKHQAKVLAVRLTKAVFA